MAVVQNYFVGIAAFVLATSGALSVAAGELRVVSSIRPVHSLVASVMRGVGKSELLISGSQSPHSITLKPSQARMLQRADTVFWIGPELEGFLSKSIDSIAPDARSIALVASPGLKKIEGTGQHDDHRRDEGKDDDHGDETAALTDAFDPHIWLDTDNAIVMVQYIAHSLSEQDAENSQNYVENAAETVARIKLLGDEINAQVASVRDQPYMVFHQAYGYFENRFGLQNSGILSPNPIGGPSAKRLQNLAKQVRSLGVKCVFSEPQIRPKAWNAIADDNGLRIDTLDPIGLDLTPGPELYFELKRNLAETMTDCLLR